jgi:hypothetical protein
VETLIYAVLLCFSSPILEVPLDISSGKTLLASSFLDSSLLLSNLAWATPGYSSTTVPLERRSNLVLFYVAGAGQVEACVALAGSFAVGSETKISWVTFSRACRAVVAPPVEEYRTPRHSTPMHLN